MKLDEHAREQLATPKVDFKVVGKPLQRVDARGHVTGRTTYFDDHLFPGMLHLVMVRSEKEHALLTRVEIEPALAVEGVVRVITYRDVPNNWYTILKVRGVKPDDEPVLAEDRVLYEGEQICAVVATTPEAAREGARRVVVEYEVLSSVLDVEDALLPATPAIKPHGTNYYVFENGMDCRRVRLGDIGPGFAAADHVFEHRYESAPIEHAPVETTGCIARPESNGRVTIYSNTQALYFTLDNTAMILGIPFNRLHIVGGTVGGGFGGKVDVIVEPICALAAMLTNRPVKYAYSRPEEMQVSSPRAAERIYIKDGITKDGRIVARQVRMYIDCGAYSRNTPYGTTKAAAHMPGPYTIPNVSIDVYCVYTNRTPASAMRGFGVTIGDFAVEAQMDRIARLVGRDPLEVRMLNAYRDGDMKAHHKEVEGAALIETIQAAARLYGWKLPDQFWSMTSSAKRGADGQA